MGVEAVTEEIPSIDLSCSPLIEISNRQEEFWEFSIYVKVVWKGRTYGIFANNEFEKGLEEPEYENKDIKISSHQEGMYPALRELSSSQGAFSWNLLGKLFIYILNI